MKNLRWSARAVAVTLALVIGPMLTAVHPAAAQVYTGRIDITVSDSTGALLPGVAVSISGPQSQEAVTDAKGEAHFLNLAPGAYQVRRRSPVSATT